MEEISSLSIEYKFSLADSISSAVNNLRDLKLPRQLRSDCDVNCGAKLEEVG